MTTPPAPTPPTPPAPAPPPPAPAPPSGAPPAPAPNGPPGDPASELAALRAAIESERGLRRKAEADLAAARRAGLSEDDKRLADAKAEGRAEAVKAAGLQVAAAEFRAAATGKLADVEAALALVDLAKFVDDDGKVDTAKIAELIGKLAAAMPPPPAPGRVPAGPQNPAPSGDPDFDFLGGGMRKQRGG